MTIKIIDVLKKGINRTYTIVDDTRSPPDAGCKEMPWLLTVTTRETGTKRDEYCEKILAREMKNFIEGSTPIAPPKLKGRKADAGRIWDGSKFKKGA